MRRSWILAAATLALATGAGRSAAAQTLDLDAASAPQTLGLDSFAADCMRALEAELDQEAGPPADGRRPADEASQGIRRVALALLERAERQGAEGSLDFRVGYLLFLGRADLDEVLDRATSPQHDDDEAAASLRRLNEQLAARLGALSEGDDRYAVDEVGELLRPLADAVAVLAPEQVVNHWVPAGDVSLTPGGAEPAAARIDRLLDRIDGGLDAARLSDPTTIELRRIAGYLRRGADYCEFRPAVERYALLLGDVLDLADAAWGAGWLDESMRDLYRRQIDDAVMLFGDPGTRPEAERRLQRIAAAKHAIERISALAEERGAPGPRSRIAAVDLEALRAAFVAASAAPGDQDQGMETLVGVLDGMIAYRALSEPQLSIELRRVWRKLDESYRRTERSVVRELPDLVGRADALSDPALAGRLREHAQYVEDLGRLAKVPAWMDTVRAISPRAVGPFSGHVRKVAGWLTDATRRPDAIRAFDEIEVQLTDFPQLPFEDALRSGGRPASLGTGGLHEPLLATIEQQRRAWAEAWETDGAAAAAERMRLLYRLTSIMAGTEALLAAGDDAAVLNRWTAWEIDPEALRRLMADLSARLKLATTAAVDLDDAGLREQLDRIRGPTTILVSRLIEALGAPLRQLPSGALSVVGQAVHRPPPDAWLIDREGTLADVCRYEMEVQYARSRGREELAERLAVFVDMLSGEVLEEIGP